MAFVTELPVFINWKHKTYDLILVMVNWLTKMIYYKLIKIIIDAFDLVEVILNVLVWYYDLLNYIMSNGDLVFISKFCLLLCYFFEIK